MDQAFRTEQLKASCRQRGLHLSGNKDDLIRRLWFSSTEARAAADSRTTGAQMTYLAAASRRQNLVLSPEVYTSRASASVWLGRHGDYAGVN